VLAGCLLAVLGTAVARSATAQPGVLETDNPQVVISGTIGRTDFPRGSLAEMQRSLAETVLPLEDRTLVLSGHGPDTTVGHERRTNPFLRPLLERPGGGD
jgi:hypothetical protein